MAEQTEHAARTDVSPLRLWIIRHPIATFLVLVYATITALVFVPRALTEPGLLPGGATPYGALENVLGSAVPAFIVTALVSGKAGVRDLARRSFRWRVPVRWYVISLLAPLLILLIAIAILYGLALLRALAQNWLLLFTGFLPALAIMIVLNNLAEEIGWTGFISPIPRSSRSAPRRPADDAVLLAVPRAEHICRNTIMGDHGTGAGHLPAAASEQPLHHRLALQQRRLQRVDRRIVPLHA